MQLLNNKVLQPSSTKVIGLAEVKRITGLSASTIDRLEKRGEFPMRRRLSPGRIGWIQDEVNHWVAQTLPVAKIQMGAN